jgi:hypothetical protein
MALGVVIAQVAPILQLLGKIIEYLTELQKNSKKHSAALAEIKAQMVQLQDTIAAGNKELRKLIYGIAVVACSPWIYIGLHLAGLIR